jgi:hypothetical protein
MYIWRFVGSNEDVKSRYVRTHADEEARWLVHDLVEIAELVDRESRVHPRKSCGLAVLADRGDPLPPRLRPTPVVASSACNDEVIDRIVSAATMRKVSCQTY